MKEIIGIIGAMNVEVATLCTQLENKKTEKISGLEFNQGLLNQKEVVIVRSGVGKVKDSLNEIKKYIDCRKRYRKIKEVLS